MAAASNDAAAALRGGYMPADRSNTSGEYESSFPERFVPDALAETTESTTRDPKSEASYSGPVDVYEGIVSGNLPAGEARRLLQSFETGRSETSSETTGEMHGGRLEPGESVEVALERADRPHDAAQPSIVRDYYPSIPPTVEDRYFVRDKANPIPLFDGPPTREQTAQGRIGDCGVVATLGGVAGHRPEAISQAITQTGDGRYEVKLHDVTPATPRDPIARPTGDTVTYRMNDEIPVALDLTGRPPVGVKADTCGWPTVMEKVVASQDQTWDAQRQADWDTAWQVNKRTVDAQRLHEGLPPSPTDAPSGYNRLDVGSSPFQRATLLAELTGEEAEVRMIPNEQQGEQALLEEFGDRLADGKPILVGTRGRLPGETEPLSPKVFAFGHAYEVTKIEGDRIHLRNPWGDRRNPPPISVQTFWEYYRHYNQDGSRTGQFSTLK